MSAPTVEARTLQGFTVHACGTVYGPSGARLSQFEVNGYLRVSKYTPTGNKAVQIHRLVCEAFHGPAPVGKPHVAHLNGDPHDNAAVNLAWVSQSENEAHKVNHGTALQGIRHHQAKLTEDDVRTIREMAGTSAEVAPLYGVSPSAIRAIRARSTWRHVR